MSIRKLVPSLKYLTGSSNLPHYINGMFVNAKGNKLEAITNPTNNKVLGYLTLDDREVANDAIINSKQAYQNWSKVSINSRVEKLLNWYSWLTTNKQNIAKVISEENGKPISDAVAELDRGLEVVKYSFSAPTLLKGDYSIINNNLEIHSKKQPLGVTLGIMPFNFPGMIPLWMIPLALVTGNSIVIKASEKCPFTPLYLAYGASLAGIPDGVFNVIHGDKYVTNNLIEHADTKAVSFVGSSEVGKTIYKLAAQKGVRSQINMGAKNHAVVMPDCDYRDTANSIISAFVMGQRCMAISVLIVVDGAEKVIDSIVEKLDEIDPVRDMGPLITPESKITVIDSIKSSVEKGATVRHGNYNKIINEGVGNYMEPIILDNVTTNMEVYNKELFAPVLSIIRVPHIDKAIEIVNKNKYGNGTVIFTTSNYYAKHYENMTDVTQCGINVPIPVSPPYYSWTSSKESYRGSHYIYGPSSFDFYSQQKTVMNRHKLNSKLVVDMPTN